MKLQPDGKTLLLDQEEVRILCRPGAGADTCIWLAASGAGFECIYHSRNDGRNLHGETLEDMWKAGKTVAKRDGCSRAKNFIQHS